MVKLVSNLVINREEIDNMYSPWVIYATEVKKLFGQDDSVKIEFDNDTPSLTLRVEGDSKADAISKLLPGSVEFGNVTLAIKVLPANYSDDRMSLLKRAFEGNPIVKDFAETEVIGNNLKYVLFKKEVVQYANDDISDLNGVCSTLYQDIAKEVLGEKEGVYFCTSTQNY